MTRLSLFFSLQILYDRAIFPVLYPNQGQQFFAAFFCGVAMRGSRLVLVLVVCVVCLAVGFSSR